MDNCLRKQLFQASLQIKKQATMAKNSVLKHKVNKRQSLILNYGVWKI